MSEESNGFSGDTIKFQKTDLALFRSVSAVKLDKPDLVSVVPESPTPEKVIVPEPTVKKAQQEKGQKLTRHLSKRDALEANAVRTQCKQLGVSIFLQEHNPVKSLGFTSAIQGEGKSFLASLTAQILAEDLKIPVTLLECNWENLSFNTPFNISAGPGLAEWLSGNCTLDAIRQPVSSNLTVITAGDGKNDRIKLLQGFRQRGISNVLKQPSEVLIVDLPAMVTTEYGQLAAKLVDSLILVVHMGVTPDAFVAEACRYLKDVPVEGVVFNQIISRIPRWLRQTL